MAHSQSVQQELRRLYIFEKFSLAKASELLNIDLSTASRWKRVALKKGDDWDKVAAAATFAGGELEDIAKTILTDLVVQYKSTIVALQNSEDLSAKDKVGLLASLSDSYNKTIAASRRILPQTSQLATVLEVLEELGNFIHNKKPDLLPVFSEVLADFGEIMAKKYQNSN